MFSPGAFHPVFVLVGVSWSMLVPDTRLSVAVWLKPWSRATSSLLPSKRSKVRSCVQKHCGPSKSHLHHLLRPAQPDRPGRSDTSLAAEDYTMFLGVPGTRVQPGSGHTRQPSATAARAYAGPGRRKRLRACRYFVSISDLIVRLSSCFGSSLIWFR